MLWASFIGIYCTLALWLPIWENDINLWVMKFIIHCKIQGPQSRTIKATITVVNIVFHQLKSRKECFHLTLLLPGFSCHLKQSIRCQISQECIHFNSALIMAQVPPWAAVSMSRAILLWITAFLIWICSSFKAWMTFVLSRRACFVKFLKASTLIMISVVPIEDTNKAEIYSYHWNTDLVHLACK